MNFGAFSIDSTTKNIAGRAFSGAGAFKSLIVDDDPTLVNLLAYVDLNPIRAGIVKRPEDYKWCTLGYFTPKTHNLIYLLNKIGKKPDQELKKFITKLNTASVATRYPDDLA